MLAGLGLAGTALLGGCGADAALDGLSSGGLARVTSVPTGDALGLDKLGDEDAPLLRLAGVEAPRGDAPFASAARDALAALALGRRVSLLFGGAHADAFGRTVAHARLEEGRLWLQGALIDAGAVRVRTTAENRALAAPMLAREATARSARKGLWADDAYRVRLPEELFPDAEGLQIVEGRVRRAGETGRLAYLDFANDWRGAASVEIPSKALKDFRSAGVDPLRLEGHLIRVRGEARGLRITLDHPEALELLRG